MSAGRSYYRIMLGPRSAFAQQCHEERRFGGGWDIAPDLTNELTDDWREFNAKFIPVYLAANPGQSKVAAGLAWSMPTSTATKSAADRSRVRDG